MVRVHIAYTVYKSDMVIPTIELNGINKYSPNNLNLNGKIEIESVI